VTLTHCPIPADRFDLVAGVEILPDQIRFSGTVKEAFETAEPKVDFHGLFEGDSAVGFYKIDQAYERTLPARGAPLLGVRAFMIDHRHQGRGLATQAVRGLAPYLQTRYPEFDAVWLTVNLSNPAALRAYLAGGFVDTGDIHPYGTVGPQHILRMVLRSA
jgi:RimJ/RimL family protein N-acetyltransferase